MVCWLVVSWLLSPFVHSNTIEKSIVERELQLLYDVFTEILDLCCSCVSSSKLFWVVCMAFPTGTEVNRAVTS